MLQGISHLQKKLQIQKNTTFSHELLKSGEFVKLTKLCYEKPGDKSASSGGKVADRGDVYLDTANKIWKFELNAKAK